MNMENKELTFNGTVLNGFLMLFVNLLLTVGSIAAIIYGAIILTEDTNVALGATLFAVHSDRFLLDQPLLLYQEAVVAGPQPRRSAHQGERQDG